MTAFIHHLAYEFKTGLRDRARLLMFYLFPLVFAGLMGGLMVQVNPDFRQRMIPAMAVFTMMCSAFLSLPGSMVNARNTGIWRSFKINAVPRSAVLAVPVIAMGLHAMLATGLIAALGVLVWGAPLPSDLTGFCLAWVLAWLAISAIGCIIGTVSANERVALLISQLFYIPSIMLGGLMMPDSILNDGMKALSWVFPASHAMHAFGNTMDVRSLAILGGIAVLGWLVTLMRFRWDAS